MSDKILNDYIRRRIESWLAEDESRTATQLAEASELTSTTISDLRSGKVGVGLASLKKLARVWHTTAAALEEAADHEQQGAQPAKGIRTVYDQPGGSSAWGDLPGWPEAEAEARRKYARLMIPDKAWEGLGS